MDKFTLLKKRSLCYLFIFLCFPVFLTCTPKRYYSEAEKLMGSLSLESRISQMLMPSVPGKSANPEAESIIKKYRPGGIILFGYNLSSKEESSAYIKYLQNLSDEHSGIPLFISIDQEGGRVVRIRDGVTRFPGAMAAGITGDESLVRRWSAVLAAELRNMGVNLNFAPVLDVNNNPDNPVINTRSFGSDKDIVSKMGIAYIRGLQGGGVIAAAKHFPGHGDTDKDSHYTLPVIAHDMKRLREVELYPFKKAVNSGVDMIMTAHIAFPVILESDIPATFSSFFLQDILREEMGFKGLVITDCLEMDAVSKRTSIGEAAVKAVEAGADILLFTTHGKTLPAVYSSLLEAVESGRISEERINSSVKRILELKIRYGILPVDGVDIKLPVRAPDRLRAEADSVNRELSRRAIYLHNGGPVSFAGSAGKYLVTGNSIIRKYLKNSGSVDLLSSLDEIPGFNNLGDSAEQRIVVVHIEESFIENLERIKTVSGKSGVPIVVLYTGNPFLVSGHTGDIPVLFTFSSTDESLRQAAACIAGEFEPLREINYDIGFSRKH